MYVYTEYINKISQLTCFKIGPFTSLISIKIFLNLTIINDRGVTLCTLRFPVQHNAKIQMLRQ
jgi:hypothetical protein